MANQLQNLKYVRVTDPAAIVDNAAFTTTEIDTLGFDYAVIVVYLGATDIAMTVCKVQESDTSGSGFADITGLVLGTSTNIDGSTSALPAATDDNTFQVFQIDLRGRKRYLDLSMTQGDGTSGGFATALCILGRGVNSPTTMAEMNANEVVRV